MWIINFIVASYFALFRKYEIKGLEAGVYCSIVPISLNILSVIFYLNKYANLELRNYLPIIVMLVFGSIAFPLKKHLDKYYLKRYDLMLTFSNRFPRLLIAIFAIFHFFLSIFFGILSMKYLL